MLFCVEIPAGPSDKSISSYNSQPVVEELLRTVGFVFNSSCWAITYIPLF